jgi:hypothetical protein
MASPADRDAAHLRDLLHAATAGDVQRWVSLEYIRRLTGLTDEACQAASRRAANKGWIATAGNRDVHSVRITAEGSRLGRRPRAR